jgi:alkaline phosphatase
MLLLVLSPFSKETSMKQVNSFRRTLVRVFPFCGYTVLLLLLLGGCTPGVKQVEKPRNIILMIGDGMGTNHIYAGMVANGMDLNLAACNYVGFQKTYSFNSDITDSGASATAMATGKKTRNGVISVGPDGKPLKTIVELAEERGLSTGLIATSTITHATPAAFAAHDTSRGNYEQIAEDLCRSGVDVIIGGKTGSTFSIRLWQKDILSESGSRIFRGRTGDPWPYSPIRWQCRPPLKEGVMYWQRLPQLR